MSIIKPRLGRFRLNIGTRSYEDGAAGDAILGITTYGHEESTGRETYEVNYISVGGRSDTVSNALQTLQGNEATTRYVDEAGNDEMYVGTSDQNEGSIDPVKDESKEAVAA